MLSRFAGKPTLSAFIILTLLILIPYWKLFLMQGFVITDDIFTSDIMNDAFPLRYFLGEALKTGHAPLWIPDVYGGFPLLARSEAGVCYPLNLVLFGLLPPYTALNFVILLTLIIAAIGMFLYVREVGGTFVAGLIGGVAFSFSGYMVSHIKHLANVNAACWLPLGFWLIERAFHRKDPKYLWLLGLVFGLQHLSGHTQIAYYSGVAYIVYFIFRYGYFQKELRREKLTTASIFKNQFSYIFVGALAVGSGLGAIQLLPTYELVSLSQRSGGVTFDYAANYAYDPKNILTFFYPYVHGDIGAGTYTGKSVFWEDYGYVGMSIMAMALYAVVRLWKKRPNRASKETVSFGWSRWYVKFFSITAVVSYLLVLGPNTPLYEAVFHLVPGMKFFRFPTRFLLFTDFSLILLGCIGITQITERFRKERVGEMGGKNHGDLFSKSGLFLLVVVVTDLWYFQLRQNPVADADRWLSPVKTVELIRSRAGESPSPDGLYRIFVIGGIESHKTAFARARGWQGDLQPYIDQREFLQPSSNVLYGFSSPDGYANLTPNYVVEVWGDQNRGGLVYETATVQNKTFNPTQAFWKLMDMYNVRFILSLWPVTHDGRVDSLGKINDVFVYENPEVFPRAYLVGNGKTVQNLEEAKRALVSQKFDPSKEVLLHELHPTPLADTLRGIVKLKSYTPNAVEFRVSTNVEAFLVFSDSYYPGWKAEIDERERQVFQANITQRAVVVPSGDHTVKFYFRSETVGHGLWISGVGFAIFIGISLVEYIKRKLSCS